MVIKVRQNKELSLGLICSSVSACPRILLQIWFSLMTLGVEVIEENPENNKPRNDDRLNHEENVQQLQQATSGEGSLDSMNETWTEEPLE